MYGIDFASLRDSNHEGILRTKQLYIWIYANINKYKTLKDYMTNKYGIYCNFLKNIKPGDNSAGLRTLSRILIVPALIKRALSAFSIKKDPMHLFGKNLELYNRLQEIKSSSDLFAMI